MARHVETVMEDRLASLRPSDLNEAEFRGHNVYLHVRLKAYLRIVGRSDGKLKQNTWDSVLCSLISLDRLASLQPD